MAIAMKRGLQETIHLVMIELIKKCKYRVSMLGKPANIKYWLFCHIHDAWSYVGHGTIVGCTFDGKVANQIDDQLSPCGDVMNASLYEGISCNPSLFKIFSDVWA